MMVRHVPYADWLCNCRREIWLQGCRQEGGFTVNRDHLFAQDLKNRANPTDVDRPKSPSAHTEGPN